ncbi:hypothetical protein ACWGHD_19065 [Streptomyces xanthophaeus]
MDVTAAKTADLAADVRDYAADVLCEWMPGYDTPETGPQRRYRVLRVSECGRYVDVQVETCDPFPADPRVVRVWLEAEDVTDE